jgi:hypothetical protein
MSKWFIAFMLALALIGGLTPLLRRLGLGRLPGDISFTFNGREYSFPFASSLLLSGLTAWLVYLLQ